MPGTGAPFAPPCTPLPESFIQLSEIAILLVQCTGSFMQLDIHFANEITFFGKFLRQLLLLLRQLTDERKNAI